MKLIGGIISLVCFLYVIIGAWTKGLSLISSIIWTVLALIPGFNIITAIAFFFLTN